MFYNVVLIFCVWCVLNFINLLFDVIWWILLVFVVISVWKFIMFNKIVFINCVWINGVFMCNNGLLLKYNLFFCIEWMFFVNFKFFKYDKKLFL